MSRGSSSDSKAESEKAVHECFREEGLKQQEDVVDNVEEDPLLLEGASSTTKNSEKSKEGADKKLYEACCEPKMRTILTTHVNVFLYATCFWIQIGVLPVSEIN